MCTKEKYDKKTCQTILNQVKKEHKKWRRECRYYLCDSCGWYHLTSKKEWEEPLQLKIDDLEYKERWLDLMK